MHVLFCNFFLELFFLTISLFWIHNKNTDTHTHLHSSQSLAILELIYTVWRYNGVDSHWMYATSMYANVVRVYVYVSALDIWRWAMAVTCTADITWYLESQLTNEWKFNYQTLFLCRKYSRSSNLTVFINSWIYVSNFECIICIGLCVNLRGVCHVNIWLFLSGCRSATSWY